MPLRNKRKANITHPNIGDLVWKKIIDDSGSIYEGYFLKEERCGEGKLTEKNGNIYQGRWKNNEKNG